MSEKVLVISLQGVGNLVMATPVIEGLARAGREVHVVVAARPVAEFVASSPWVAGATSLEGARRGAARAGAALRGGRFDASVSTYPNGRRAALLAVAAGARERVGFADGLPPWMHRAYTRRLSTTAGLHDVDQNLKLLDALGVPRPAIVAPHAPITEEDRAFGERFFAEAGFGAGRRVAALHPGGAATGLFRRWPPENFGELARRLRRDLGLGVVLVGEEAERPMLDMIARAAGECAAGESAAAVRESAAGENAAAAREGAPGKSARAGAAAGAGRETLAVAAGPSLGHVAAVIERCAVFVGNDSGPLHIAAALGVPVVGIYGPTNEIRTAPYGSGHTVLTAPVSCRPCYAFGERFSCEFDQLLCLELIDVDAVLAAVKATLEARAGEDDPRSSPR